MQTTRLEKVCLFVSWQLIPFSTCSHTIQTREIHSTARCNLRRHQICQKLVQQRTQGTFRGVECCVSGLPSIDLNCDTLCAKLFVIFSIDCNGSVSPRACMSCLSVTPLHAIYTPLCKQRERLHCMQCAGAERVATKQLTCKLVTCDTFDMPGHSSCEIFSARAALFRAASARSTACWSPAVRAAISAVSASFALGKSVAFEELTGTTAPFTTHTPPDIGTRIRDRAPPSREFWMQPLCQGRANTI